MSELADIFNRLTILETQSEERWIAHDRQSKIIWSEIKSDIMALFAKIDSNYGKKDICMKEAKEYTNIEVKEAKEYAKTLVAWVLGVPVCISTIMGIIWGIIKISQALNLI